MWLILEKVSIFVLTAASARLDQSLEDLIEVDAIAISSSLEMFPHTHGNHHDRQIQSITYAFFFFSDG